MTQFYIGCKQVEAWPQEKDGQAGYGVKYPDGYVSWSPKDVFERAYLPMGEKNSPFGTMPFVPIANADTITQRMVDAFIREIESWSSNHKTTIVSATLVNGFEIVEASSCVDPANYSHEIGKEICLQRIKSRVWQLLGFLLQTARNGVKPA